MHILFFKKKIDINELGRMLNETWEIKKSLSGSVSNNKIDTIYDIAKKNGALGGKLLGAGGGGFLLIMAPIEAQIKIKKKLKNLFFVPFKIHFTGSEIVVNQPNGFNE
jgi:D-glycero-alpha-D-manno-heptose-7-phosphate kinase